MKTAISLIERNDWLTNIDIKDAYLHAQLHAETGLIRVELVSHVDWISIYRCIKDDP